MGTIKATFIDRDTKRIETPRGTWFLCGVDDVPPDDIETLTTSHNGVEFCSDHRGTLAVHVGESDAGEWRVSMWKGLLSTYEIYYSVRPGGGLVLSDHFRNVIAILPIDERLPDEASLTAHYLFRKPYGKRTYSRSVKRLSSAEHLVIDVRTGQIESSLFDRIENRAEPRPRSEYVDVMDKALGAACSAIPQDGSTSMMFSGGVDSTLLLTYLGEGVDPITFVPDTVEFNPETSYARNAIELLGMKTHEIPMYEATFVDMMERTTDTLATPVFDDATPYLHELIHRDGHDGIFGGGGADSAFGQGVRLNKFASWFSYPGVRDGLAAAAPRVPGLLSRQEGP